MKKLAWRAKRAVRALEKHFEFAIPIELWELETIIDLMIDANVDNEAQRTK